MEFLKLIQIWKTSFVSWLTEKLLGPHPSGANWLVFTQVHCADPTNHEAKHVQLLTYTTSSPTNHLAVVIWTFFFHDTWWTLWTGERKTSNISTTLDVGIGQNLLYHILGGRTSMNPGAIIFLVLCIKISQSPSYFSVFRVQGFDS